jgi:hypothetical protein
MRSHWSVLKAAATAVSLSVLFSISGHGSVASGDTQQASGSEAAPPSAPTESLDVSEHAGPQKDPFSPYDVGGPEAIWPYESLSPAEQALVDRSRDAKGWATIHDAFSAAAVERSHKAATDAAQHQLGVDNLELTGVVP